MRQESITVCRIDFSTKYASAKMATVTEFISGYPCRFPFSNLAQFKIKPLFCNCITN